MSDTPLVFGISCEDAALLEDFEFKELWRLLGRLARVRATRLAAARRWKGPQPWTPAGRSLAYRSDGRTQSALFDIACEIERQACGEAPR